MQPRTLILRTAGTNCDGETAYAFERAGALTEAVHINRILENPGELDRFAIMAIPGGFSYGDDIAAGRIFANQIRHHLGDALRRFVEAGKPIIGICNGFQVLIKTDLLPGGGAGSAVSATGQTCTLAHNDCGRFMDRWIRLIPQGGKCIWTRGLEPFDLPIAHGEGKFVPRDESVRKALWDGGQVALVYGTAENSPAGNTSDNPNGSVDAIAGISDATGLVFGLMPHPERYVDGQQHPAWAKGAKTEEGAGLAVFLNAVAVASQL